MEDLQKTLQQILSDPDQMAQLQAMASALGLNPEAQPLADAPQTASASPRNTQDSGPSPAPLPDEMMAALPEIMGKLGRLHGPEEQVLAALRPALSPEKQGKIDKALQAARISRLAGQFLRNKEGADV